MLDTNIMIMNHDSNMSPFMSEIPLEYCNELTFTYGNVVVAKINHPPCWSFLIFAGVREIIMITIDRIRGWAVPAGRGLSCHGYSLPVHFDFGNIEGLII